MPLDKLVLILACVAIAAGVTLWLGALVLATVQIPGLGIGVMIVAGLVAYVVWRVIADRLSSREDDHYDEIEK